MKTHTFPLAGGLDLVTKPVKKAPGRIIGGENYEPTDEGYTRFAGYERFDGQPKPSEAKYWIIPFSDGSQEPQEGDVITGSTSGASGKCLGLTELVSGSYGTSDAAGNMVLTAVSGEFQASEDLQISAVTVAVASDEAVEAGADNDDDDLSFRVAAIETARALIQPVPGSGPIRGVWMFKSKVYAFRDSADASKGVMFEASSSGWVQKADTFPAGGRYEFINANFYGTENFYRMYGVNGVGKAFFWDESTVTFIDTGLDAATDKPQHLAEMALHLFLSYDGGSVLYSGTGKPDNFEAINGAGEFGIGQDIVGLMGSARTTLLVFGVSKVSYLTGSSSQDFELNDVTDEAGAFEWTTQQAGDPLYFDNRGIRSLSTTEALGNWKRGTKTDKVVPWLKRLKKAGAKPVASMRVRSKDQYRLFFDDGSTLVVYLGASEPEILPLKLGKVPTCTCSAEDLDGNEILLFGGDDGFIYQSDVGTSFDGDPVPAFARLAFNHHGSPKQNKRYFKATLDVDVTQRTKLGLIVEFGYADPENIPPQEQEFNVTGGGGFWDEDKWDEFLWSAPVQGTAEAYIDGFGLNVSIGVISEEAYEEPHTLSSVTIHYENRGQEK